MNLQFLADGIITGAMIGLGAIGVTLAYSILRFANFAHGEFISWGAYIALGLSSALAAALTGSATPLGSLSFGWGLALALVIAMPLTGALALALDWLLFARLRARAAGITIVMVTHELDIAAYCKRIVVMRDGQIISDTRNENRRNARQEIDALNQAEWEAKLA